MEPSLRAQQILSNRHDEVNKQTDRVFRYLLLAQWMIAILFTASSERLAIMAGGTSVAIFQMGLIGLVINLAPLYLITTRCGSTPTRISVVAAQSSWTAIYIFLAAGRPEAQLHLYISLAFIALYRDWRWLLIPTIVGSIANTGAFLPEVNSDFPWWYPLEQRFIMLLVDAGLWLACRRTSAEMAQNAQEQAELEEAQERVGSEVAKKVEELQSLQQAQESMQLELMQAQKLESVGRLASGVAHEINTPIQFVSDSLYFIEQSIIELLLYFNGVKEATKECTDPEMIAKLQQLEEDADLEYMMTNLPKAIQRSSDGLRRVSEIVRSMKEFAHPDQQEMVATDINRLIETTLIVAKHEYKYTADVETNLGSIPQVVCHGGELNQVLINMIVNSAHAIEQKVSGSEERGTITISTYEYGEYVVVQIADTGSGIPTAIQDRIFDPFFTTKEVGKGTGQGLAIAYNVVTKKLGGQIDFESSKEGTTFFLYLPIIQSKELVA